MHAFNDLKIEKSGDSLKITILICVALAIGLYLIATTVVIAKDGVGYIEDAKDLAATGSLGSRVYGPGYPYMISAWYRVLGFVVMPDSLVGWTTAAQSVTLLCKIAAIIPLYFVGKLVVGAGKSFWAVLILLILPAPAKYGSDVLREWPYILFLGLGLLLLMLGSRRQNIWAFAGAGICAGVGQMIRPEAVLLMLVVGGWAVAVFAGLNQGTGKGKTALMALAALAGFAIPSIFYVKVGGDLVAPQLRGLFAVCQMNRNLSHVSGHLQWVCAQTQTGVLESSWEVLEVIGQTVNYVFVVPLLLGAAKSFRRGKDLLRDEWFFIWCLMGIYFGMLVLLHVTHGYVSSRHCLPMIAFAVFFVPVGGIDIAKWLHSKLNFASVRMYALFLLAAAIAVCLPRLFRPINFDKQQFLQAAEWLDENCPEDALIGVLDARLGFYSSRQWEVFVRDVPSDADYVAIEAKDYDRMENPSARRVKTFSGDAEKEGVYVYKLRAEEGG
ncbi:putative membrane protein [Anaerohalosphaera lusitana]|uniref:Putative membrane protein n=1 Tax=Anaerohalosphaera lusitana TaxID=1936003 RepID=A0A1U9NNT5_9BACT|nr:glycosyltransferase family 39 protein [Anaerohalosphaera lusitana]AQT69612.1 putative membrane protein [Anaerohalosphaera lusitana]